MGADKFEVFTFDFWPNYIYPLLWALLCQMCGNHSKTKSEIMKHYQKDHIFFFILNFRFWDFKPLLEKAKLPLVDSYSDKPKALIRNIASQPFR